MKPRSDRRRPWEWWPTWLIAISGWVIVVVLIWQGSCEKNSVIVAPTPSDQEVKTRVKRELDDFGQYMKKLEQDTYTIIGRKGSELTYRGLGQGSKMRDMLEREEKHAADSLDAHWVLLERNLQDIVFSSGLRDTTIRTIPFLQNESAIKDSLENQISLCKNRIHDFVDQKKSARGLK